MMLMIYLRYNNQPMDILTQLKDERDRIDAAIKALSGGRGGARVATNGRRKRRKLSAAARRKIAAAARARWASAKKAGRNRL
jgi:hypothetical protein